MAGSQGGREDHLCGAPGDSAGPPPHLLSRSLETQGPDSALELTGSEWRHFPFGRQLPHPENEQCDPGEKGDPSTRPGMNHCVAQVGCCYFRGLSFLSWNRANHCHVSCLLKSLGLGLQDVSYHLSQSTSFYFFTLKNIYLLIWLRWS